MVSLYRPNEPHHCIGCAHSFRICSDSALVTAHETPIYQVNTQRNSTFHHEGSRDDNVVALQVDRPISLTHVDSTSTERHRNARADNTKHSAKGVVHQDSLVGALRPAILVAQLVSLLPVENASSATPTFQWCSYRVCYTLFVSCIMVVVFFLHAYHALAKSHGVESSQIVMFFGNAACTILLFLHLATRWPRLSRIWAENEASMRVCGYPKYLGRKAHTLTAVVLLLASVEHIIAIASVVVTVWPCYVNGGFQGLVESYSRFCYTADFDVISYAHWKGIFIILVNVIAMFAWNFSDLFIMLLSIALAKRFQLLNKRLSSLHGKNLPSNTWRELRESYNSLTLLTKALDGCLGYIVVMSLATNLYIICIKLFEGINPKIEIPRLAYYLSSFGYLIGRTFSMMLCAASIHDESKEIRTTLYAVPAESYCNEVERFLNQVTTDEVSLTGCGFFRVTRSLTLAVAGTIVTYEIVLMQLHPYGRSGNGNNSPNSTDESIIGATSNRCPYEL